MAAIAALSARFGVSFLVAILCAVVAMVGTWRFLAAGDVIDVDADNPMATQGQRGQRASADQIAFAPLPDEGVRAVNTRPRAPAAVTGTATAAVVGAPSTMQAPPAEQVPPAVPSDAAPLDEIGWLPDDKPDSLGGAERLPDGAQALAITPPEQWEASVTGAYTIGKFEVRASSSVGTDHALLSEERQDDFVVARAGGNKYLIVVVANGVRTAEHAHLGSFWAARLLARNIELHLRDGVPGIEKMLDRTRTDLRVVFDEHFGDDTKLRTIATRLVGLIAPVDGGPAAGFRVGDGELLMEGPLGWSSVFGEPPPPEANMVFPRVSAAEVVSIDCAQGTLLLAGDGVHKPLASDEKLAGAISAGLRQPASEAGFAELLDFDIESARDDRTAVAVWLRSS